MPSPGQFYGGFVAILISVCNHLGDLLGVGLRSCDPRRTSVLPQCSWGHQMVHCAPALTRRLNTTHSSGLSEAAKELGLPTSTVSRSLTRLEKHLGLLLVRRGQRGLLLTDAGSEYLKSSVEALHTLRNAGELLDRNRSHPRGVLKVACPITMARDVMGPLMRRFVDAQPELRVDIQPYSSLWDQEPKEDIDIFFKIRAPMDSLRRVHHYPSAKRALYASKSYVRKYGLPNDPAELSNHRCTGSADDAFYGNWKLTKGEKTVELDLIFQVMSSDPFMHRQMVLDGIGISILP